MRDLIRRAVEDLNSLSQIANGSDQERILETISRFKNMLEENEEFISLYKKLSFDIDTPSSIS
jgi:hypothetical protein